jgi:hypothetical protein
MEPNRDSYNRRKARAANRDRAESAAGKDIGELPGVRNLKRRKACERNLLKYLLTYHKESFPLDFSTDQHEFIKAIEHAVLNGGAQAQAMPRGSGKTTIILCADCWATAYGHRRFIVLIGAEQEAADELCDDIRMMWETNDLLLEDFPEIAFPIRALEGVVNRAKAQTINGRQTFMRWSGSKLVFPTVMVPPSDPRARPKIKPNDAGLVPTVSSGSVLRARGLLARIRGMKSTTPAGDTIRPDLVLVEDFQTDASAKSDTQCATREKTIAGAVLGLAGPGKRIAAFATCTVIRKGDSADRVLNRKLYPKWKGKRCKLVNAWPSSEAAVKHWEKYQELRQAELEEGNDEHPKATAYYKKHRKAMDEGADVPWAARKFPHELSAVEHAQNLRFDNPDTFEAEYQNEPKDDHKAAADLRILTSDEHCLNVNHLKRGEVPADCGWLTVGIDVQGTLLYYVVAAVNAEFGGAIIDYGSWPEQPGHYFRLSEAERTIQQATGKANQGAAIRGALDELVAMLAGKAYTREDGVIMSIDRGLVDAGFETQNVYKWAKSTSAPFLPSMGQGVGAKQKAWDTIKRQRGERAGHGWRMPAVIKTAGARRVDIDTNTWKTAILSRFALPDGEPGRWQLFKRSPTMHRMIADHLSAEFATKTAGRGRELYEWSARPNTENHFLDCLIYAGVAANMAGARLPEETAVRLSKPPERASAAKASKVSTVMPRAEDKREDRKLSLAELRAAKRKAA